MTIEEAQRAHRCLRAVWVLVSAMHNDAVAHDVEEMGKKLGAAIEGGDLRACARLVEQVRVWMTNSAGVVTSRMQYVFES